MEAINKKIKAESRRKNLVPKEATDGSNMTVALRASAFEFIKAKFISEIKDDKDIISITNGEGFKVATGSSGDAFVEYQMDIAFTCEGRKHGVKFKAFTTTCNIMVQHKNETLELHQHLGNKYVSKYFVERFLVSWFDKAVSDNRFTKAVRDEMMASLNMEKSRLENSKENEVKTAQEDGAEKIQDEESTTGIASDRKTRT